MPMEIDPEELKKTVAQWLDALRRIEAELLAYVLVVAEFAKEDPKFVAKVLGTARKSPKIVEVLDQKYDPIRREMIEHIERGSLNQALAQYLRDWKPENPIN
jgi:hypothetical protein